MRYVSVLNQSFSFFFAENDPGNEVTYTCHGQVHSSSMERLSLVLPYTTYHGTEIQIVLVVEW